MTPPTSQNLKHLEGKYKKEIIEKLNDQFGINNIPGELFMRGNEKIFLFQGNFDEEKIRELEKISFVERVGVYLGKIEEYGIRLSIEGTQILKNEIIKNIVELDKEEMERWMMGHEILKKTEITGFVIVKYKNEMLGTGKASIEKITNFIPKSRRLRDRSIEH
ncbi:hypothetical protein COU58_00515 [Candidatus Pacearchaeota archaeon CG10_big_fil_rev_8_21_14_0_10_32_42]|nr:MAG: hypothetical protein COU58_00515 [Candidatus Pacearchaeota archaeon CG10_big_fil_rev_8_21_14_0_10_32_42]